MIFVMYLQFTYAAKYKQKLCSCLKEQDFVHLFAVCFYESSVLIIQFSEKLMTDDKIGLRTKGNYYIGEDKKPNLQNDIRLVREVDSYVNGHRENQKPHEGKNINC